MYYICTYIRYVYIYVLHACNMYIYVFLYISVQFVHIKYMCTIIYNTYHIYMIIYIMLHILYKISYIQYTYTHYTIYTIYLISFDKEQKPTAQRGNSAKSMIN